MPNNGNTNLLLQHFWMNFLCLVCLLIKKLILESKTTWQSMRKFPYAVWSVSTFPHLEKEETFFFLKTTHWHGLNFLYNYLFTRLENLKTSLKIKPQTFLREKLSTFSMSKWYMCTFWLLITLCIMPKGLVTWLQSKQQLCIHFLYESLIGQCEYGSWCMAQNALGQLDCWIFKSNISRAKWWRSLIFCVLIQIHRN